MAHIKDVKIGNNTYLVEPAVYAATAGTSSAITAAISNFALDTGVVVNLKITTANAADATLEVNGTGKKTIKYNNENIAAGALKANRFYSLLYDGTYWQLIGELDTDTWRPISDAVNSTSSDVSASSKAVKTAYDLADGKVSKSGDTMTGSLIASASENSISDIKYYKHSATAGKTHVGWVKIAQFNLNDNNHFGQRVFDFYLVRNYISPQPESYNIRVTISWSAANIIQLGGSVVGNIIEKFRVVKDNTNHKVFFEYFVKTSASSSNTVNIRIIEYYGTSNLILLNEVQTEEDSAFANKWEIELANNKIVSDINGTATNVTGTVAIENGGTNATTAAGARTNLGLGSMAVETAADYLKLSGGTMAGPLQWTKDALPEKTSPNYFLAIDAFADGGKTYWTGKANVKATLLDTDATHNNAFLRKDGTWQTPPYPVTSVAGKTGAVTLISSDVGAYSTTEIDNRLKKYLSYAHYSHTSSNSSNNNKYYKININSTLAWMLNFTIKLYHDYRAYDLQISGYNYGSNHWWSPAAIILGASTTHTVDVIFGYDSDFHLWIAIPARGYAGIDVLNATNGHRQITDIENLFSIELVDEEPTTKQETITAYRPWYRDETIPIENGGTNATTATEARTSLGLGSIAVKADTDYLPVSYSNLDYSSTTTTNGVYPVSGQTLQSIIGSTSSTKVYGGAIQFGNVSASNNSYGAQLVVASASGATSAPHAYIRRITSDSVWGTWSTLLDNNNARTLLGVTDNSSNADVTSSDTNLITGRTLYYQLAKKSYAPIASPTFTGTPKSVTPTSSSDSKMIATKEYVDNAFAANDAMIFKGTIGSSDATVTALPATHNIGWTYRVITADEYAGIQCEIGDLIICVTNGTTADNSHWTVAQTNIDGAVIGPASSTANRLAIFSGTTGKEIKDSGVTLNTSSGSTTKWLTEKGTWTTPTAANVGLGNVDNSTYAGGTAVTLNNSSKASSTASFYAPTTGGTANTQALVGDGATAAPKWVDISPSITIGAGTGSAAPTVNVTVLGRSGTAQSITTASTSVYGVTKLNDGITSNSTSLAATANSALIAAKKVASSNNTSKLYLVGATSQSTTGVDSYSYQYTYTDNGILSALKLGLNLNGTEKAHLEWNDTDQSIDFIFE